MVVIRAPVVPDEEDANVDNGVALVVSKVNEQNMILLSASQLIDAKWNTNLS